MALVVILFLTFALNVKVFDLQKYRCGRDDPIVSTTQQQLGLVNLSDWLRLIIQASSGIGYQH